MAHTIVTILWLLWIGLTVNLFRWCKYDKTAPIVSLIVGGLIMLVVGGSTSMKDEFNDRTASVPYSITTVDKSVFLIYQYKYVDGKTFKTKTETVELIGEPKDWPTERQATFKAVRKTWYDYYGIAAERAPEITFAEAKK